MNDIHKLFEAIPDITTFLIHMCINRLKNEHLNVLIEIVLS